MRSETIRHAPEVRVQAGRHEQVGHPRGAILDIAAMSRSVTSLSKFIRRAAVHHAEQTNHDYEYQQTPPRMAVTRTIAC